MKFKCGVSKSAGRDFLTDQTLDQVQFLIPTHHSHHPTRSLLHPSPLSRCSLNLPHRDSMSLDGICVALVEQA